MTFRRFLVLAAAPVSITAGIAACSGDVTGGPGDAGTDAQVDATTNPDASTADGGADAAPTRDSAPEPCRLGTLGQIGATASAWTYTCNGCTTTVTDATDAGFDAGPDGSADAGTPGAAPTCGTAVRFESNAATGALMLRTPATGELNADVRSLTTLRMYLRADNPNRAAIANTWQGLYPTVVLRSSTGGELRYQPTYHYLPYAWQEGWQLTDVPLAGGRGWTRTGVGPDGGPDGGNPADVLGDVDSIEIAADTWEFAPFTIDVAAMTFLTVAPPACDDLVLDFSATNPNPPWQYGAMPLANATFAPLTTILASTTQGVVGFGPSSGTFPHVLRNANRVPASLSEGKMATGSLLLHPGPAGERAVVRWTAPRSGSYDVRVSFDPLTELTNAANIVTTDVHVVHGGTPIFDGAMNLADAGGSASYSGNRNVNAGDTIDVIVGYGDGNDTHDFAVVRGTICPR